MTMRDFPKRPEISKRQFPSRESVEFLMLLAKFTVFAAVVGGWIANIVKITGLDFSEPVTVEVVLRIVGVAFFPLGTVMGYL